MPNQIKAPKSTKNQPQPFRESLAAAAPGRAGLAAPALPKVSLQVVLWAIWALATIAFGIGIGRLIADRTATVSATPGTPVAQANIQQPAPASQKTIAQPVPATQPDLTVKPGASSVNQASSGSPAAVLATVALQSASDPDSLQPGYITEVRAQGNIGTRPSL